MMDFRSNFSMTIGGVAHSTADSFAVRNPATLELLARAPAATASDFDAAVAAARGALQGWSGLGVEGRRPLLRTASKGMRENLNALAALLTAEQGKPIAEATDEVGGGAYWLSEVCKLDLPPVIHEDSTRRRIETLRLPIGVVGAIVPWNFPVLLTMFKLAPALLAGNCIVLKPSPFTPLTALKIGEMLRDILPAGVLNVVSGDDALGPLLTSHAGIDKISFTGSTETGRQVMGGAARTLKRVTLELGGNDAAIVLPDVDIESVVPKLFWAAMRNNGQLCIASKRLYVHEAIFDRFMETLIAYARSVRIGDGASEGTQLGPLQNERQKARVEQLIAGARQAGLEVVSISPQTMPATGHFMPITIVIDPPEDASVVAEEQFGPIIPVMKVSGDEEAIKRANASPYGLAGSIWSADLARAREVAGALATGTVWINDAHFLSPLIPFSGHRQSGFGTENGEEGLREFTIGKTIVTTKAEPPGRSG